MNSQKTEQWPDQSATAYNPDFYMLAHSMRLLADAISRPLWVIAAQIKTEKEERKYADIYDKVAAGIKAQTGSSDGYGLMIDSITRKVLDSEDK